MKKVFWENPYQQQLLTTVAEVDGNKVLFSDTIAYSFSGGQESDRATVNGIPVQHSEKVDHLIYYTLPDSHGLTVGDQVFMEIDWPRRYRIMRLHFAAELVLEIVTQSLGLEKIGAHIAENKARIDFFYDQSVSPKLDNILNKYNAIIERDEPIEVGYSDEANQRRYWKIDGFAEVPCGGTHVRSTKEVGFVKLKRNNIGKGKERIEIKLVKDVVPEPVNPDYSASMWA